MADELRVPIPFHERLLAVPRYQCTFPPSRNGESDVDMIESIECAPRGTTIQNSRIMKENQSFK